MGWRCRRAAALVAAPAMGRSRMVHGRSESRRTIAGWTNCLLFFIDETGHETFADKNYLVFRLGGDAINSSSAAAVIVSP